MDEFENSITVMEENVSSVLTSVSADNIDDKYDLEKIKGRVESYKKKYRKELESLEKKKSEARVNIKELFKSLKATEDEDERLEIEKSIVREKSVLKSMLQVVPASEIPTVFVADVLAYGEYIDKPYDTEKLAQLIEMNQRLKSCTVCVATNVAKKGVTYVPSDGHIISKFSDTELEQYHEQGVALLKWYKSICGIGKDVSDLAYEQILNKMSLGESYIEQVERMNGEVFQVKTVSPIFIFEGRMLDRYIWIRDGMKKYFKKYTDEAVRDCWTFNKGAVKLTDRANKLIPYKEYSILSDVYGIPNWTPSIPAVLGNRYASERNVNLLNNDAVPRMIVMVSGGTVDEATKTAIQNFFRKGKGRENAGRVLVMCISAKNQLSPDAKPPTVTLEPLTVNKKEDASFSVYQHDNNAQITESFRLAETFLGVSGTANRASSYTLRDQTVETVFRPESESISTLLNDTLTRKWGIEKGYIKLDKNGNEIENKLLVSVHFNTPRTMSEKDERELQIQEVIAGVVTINDYRVAHDMDEIPRWWAYLPKPLLVPAMQMSELSPDLVSGLTPYDEYGNKSTDSKSAKDEKGTEEKDEEEAIVKSYSLASNTLMEMNKALNVLFTTPSEKINPEILKRIDTIYKLNRLAHSHESE